MALTGAWRSSVAVEADAERNWGRGWNAVHATHQGEGRNIAPNKGATSLADVVPIDYTDAGPYEDDPASDGPYAYTHEDDIVWGYGIDDGTADHPGWGESTPSVRGTTQTPEPPWPEWGPYTNGIPGGTIIRDENRGAALSKRPKQRPTETVSEGWRNKEFFDQPEDANTSDPSQLLMQTSMMQRDQTRSGSQAAQGRANAERASIRSRVVGMRLKVFSGGLRHYDMTPRHADEIVRPWWSRQAGTANPNLMAPNEMTVRQPITRQVPAEPDQGDSTPLVDYNSYGYVGEDVIPYA